jgi:hypothetical protein
MVRSSAAVAHPMTTARVAEQVRTVQTPRTQTAAAPVRAQAKDSFKSSGKAQVLNLSGRAPAHGEESLEAYTGGKKAAAEWSEEQVSEQARGSLAQLLVGEGMDAAAAQEFMTTLCSALEGNTSDLLDGEALVDLSQEQTDGSVF